MPAERRHPTTYGWRAKIGLIVPPTNTVNEAEWQAMAPQGVTIHTTRMPLHADTSSEAGRRALYADIEKATADLAQAGLDCIAYGCTAGSMVLPTTQLSDFMERLSGIRCVTTAASLVNALTLLGAKRVAAATPYGKTVNAHERDFFESLGFELVSLEGLGIGEKDASEIPQIAKTPPARIHDHVLSADRAEADVMMISCTDFPVLGLIPRFEAEIGKPVITGNQATFWAALRAADIADQFPNYGLLLAAH